jgi:hypothetical protein
MSCGQSAHMQLVATPFNSSGYGSTAATAAAMPAFNAGKQVAAATNKRPTMRYVILHALVRCKFGVVPETALGPGWLQHRAGQLPYQQHSALIAPTEVKQDGLVT